MDLQQSSQPIAQILQALCFWASINLSLQGHWPAILISQNTESSWHIFPRLSNCKKGFIQKGVKPQFKITWAFISAPSQGQNTLSPGHTAQGMGTSLLCWQIKADWCPHTRVWGVPTGNNIKQDNKECLSQWNFQCYFTSSGRRNHSKKN